MRFRFLSLRAMVRVVPLVWMGVIFFPQGVGAESLREAVDGLLERHDRVLAARADVSASSERKGAFVRNTFLPNFRMSSHIGRERQTQQTGGVDSDLTSKELDLTITQLLFDWGKGLTDVRALTFQESQLQSALDTASQALVLDAVTNYLSLLRAHKVMGYASQSVENIRRQGRVESARISLGKGYASDELQVRAQLAGAEARLVQSKGAVFQAEDHSHSVFLRDPTWVMGLQAPDPSLVVLPPTLEQSLAIAVATNPQLAQLAASVNMLQANRRSTRMGQYLPTLNGVLEHKMKQDVGGVIGYERENFVRAEVAFPFNLGLSSLNTVRAAEKDVDAATNRYNDTLLQIREQVSTTWHNLDTARKNAELLATQADLARKFLELAREERALDKRTLLDILNGETSLINAQSDAISAATDVQIATYTLLQTMGTLSTTVLNPKAMGKSAPGYVPPANVLPGVVGKQGSTEKKTPLNSDKKKASGGKSSKPVVRKNKK